MSDQIPMPAASNTFERIKRTNTEGGEFWSARDLARVLEYSVFHNFQPVIEKAREACIASGRAVTDHFAEVRNMVITSRLQNGRQKTYQTGGTELSAVDSYVNFPKS